jgi:UDP-N-acetylmuramoyl-L-alanyl-D-glutamate--2,6-diaminopimelate ligase
MIKKLKKLIGPHNPIRLWWHKLKAIAANFRYGFPARKLKVIGVTGTDGKSTTCKLISAILEKAGKKVGMLSSVEIKIGEKEFKNKSHKTSLKPFELQKYLRQMVDEGCEYVVLETASHGIAQNRIWGVPYDVVALTNLTPEHLDYHGSMAHYRDTKAKLFRQLMKSKKKGVPKTIVVNVDDEYFDHFVKFDAEQKMSFGFRSSSRQDIDSHVGVGEVDYQGDYSDVTLKVGDKEKRVRLKLPGDFNVSNLMAAAAIADALGIDLDVVEQGASGVTLVPGRMEAIDEGQPFKVLIDFAMTEAGYRNLLGALRPITDGKVWIVFGCCGDRDRDKRPGIGRAAGELADRTIVCDDEPYTEDPEAIRQMILQGLDESDRVRNEHYFEIPDRSEAFEFAFKSAQPGDTVVIPGMGDFVGRTGVEGAEDWSDREEARKLLRKLRSSV